jgi:uncharacterized membrane protein YbaN (DUF454 family)
LARAFHLGAAAVFFALAILGAALPLLPCTPFLLLTSYYLVRCSPILHARLLRLRGFGPLLRDWHERGGVRPQVRSGAIATIVLAVTGSTWCFGPSTWLAAVTWLGAAAGVTCVARLPLVRPEDRASHDFELGKGIRNRL